MMTMVMMTMIMVSLSCNCKRWSDDSDHYGDCYDNGDLGLIMRMVMIMLMVLT